MHLMGERQGWLFEPTFNRSIKLRQADFRISDNPVALLLREVDHRLGFTADLAAGLIDPRDPARTRYQQVELLRQHLYALALGHVHQDDQDLLAHAPGLKLAVWDRPGQGVLNQRLARTVEKARKLACHLDVRIDAGLVNGRTLDVLDDRAVRFVGRLKNNARLNKLAEPYLSRPPGRPPNHWSHEKA
jgi:hypothetical protein